MDADPADDADYPSYSPGAYYVDIVSGDNLTGDGTAETPWKTLSHTMHRVDDGAEGSYSIYISSGTYSVGNGETDDTHTITKDNVTFIGEAGSMPVVDGAGATICTIGVEIAASHVTIKNVALRGFDDWGIRFSSGTGNLIEGCEIHNNGYIAEGGGIHVANCSPDIRKNKIHDNYPIGILIEGDEASASPRIERNEIYAHNIGIGINGYGTGGSADPMVTNNLVYGIDSAMSFEIKCGIGISAESGGTASPAVYHNTLDGGPSHGIYVLNVAGTTTPDIKYNIIGNFAGYGINNTAGSPFIDYNDVWNNTQGNYFGCEGLVGAHEISQDPLYGSYALQSGSPCIDKIPAVSDDPVTIDFAGYARPKGSGHDIGAYEFIADIAQDFALPGGTGEATDYRMFTVPVTLATGSSLKQSMENVLGAYAKGIWRVFAWDPGSSAYIEMDDPSFAELAVYPGRGFWVISTATDTITFSGQPAPDGEYMKVPLSPDWNMVALPWPNNEIELDKIAVSDGFNTFFITSTNNTLTQQQVWDYTGSGSHNGYDPRASGAVLQPGTAYWIKVLGTAELTMLVPKDNAGGYFTASSAKAGTRASKALEDIEKPPPPPGVSMSFESTSSDGETGVSGSAGCFIGAVAPME